MFFSTYTRRTKKTRTHRRQQTCRHDYDHSDSDACSDSWRHGFDGLLPTVHDIECSPDFDYDTTYTFGDTQDMSGRTLPPKFISPEEQNTVQPNPFHNFPFPKNGCVSVAIVVPDMYEHVLKYLNNKRSVDELVRYLRPMYFDGERDASHPSLLEFVCSKVLEQIETRIRDRNIPRDLKYSSIEASLVSTLAACLDMDHRFLLNKALCCLRGAPIPVFSNILCVAPHISFHVIEEGLEIAVESLQTFKTRYHILKKFFK
ncbi:hypothetical protein CC86DRAFT_472840, partial [Ophiobolus disseminans]